MNLLFIQGTAISCGLVFFANTSYYSILGSFQWRNGSTSVDPGSVG